MQLDETVGIYSHPDHPDPLLPGDLHIAEVEAEPVGKTVMVVAAGTAEEVLDSHPGPLPEDLHTAEVEAEPVGKTVMVVAAGTAEEVLDNH